MHCVTLYLLVSISDKSFLRLHHSFPLFLYSNHHCRLLTMLAVNLNGQRWTQSSTWQYTLILGQSIIIFIRCHTLSWTEGAIHKDTKEKVPYKHDYSHPSYIGKHEPVHIYSKGWQPWYQWCTKPSPSWCAIAIPFQHESCGCNLMTANCNVRSNRQC